MSMLGWRARGARYGDLGIAIARQFDDLWMQAQAFNYKGIGLYASACYDEGLGHLGEAIRLFERAGDLWELNLAHFHSGCCQFGLGNLAEAVAEARWVFASSAAWAIREPSVPATSGRGPRAATFPSRS